MRSLKWNVPVVKSNNVHINDLKLKHNKCVLCFIIIKRHGNQVQIGHVVCSLRVRIRMTNTDNEHGNGIMNVGLKCASVAKLVGERKEVVLKKGAEGNMPRSRRNKLLSDAWCKIQKIQNIFCNNLMILLLRYLWMVFSGDMEATVIKLRKPRKEPFTDEIDQLVTT